MNTNINRAKHKYYALKSTYCQILQLAHDKTLAELDFIKAYRGCNDPYIVEKRIKLTTEAEILFTAAHELKNKLEVQKNKYFQLLQKSVNNLMPVPAHIFVKKINADFIKAVNGRIVICERSTAK